MSGPNTSTSTTGPNPQFTSSYNDLVGRAQGNASVPYSPYPGQQVAQLSDDQNAGIVGARTAQGAADPYLVQAANHIADSTTPLWSGVQQFSPGAVQQYESPYTNDVVHATEAEFNNQNQQQQQGIVGDAISKGAWGGDRSAVAQGILAGQQQLAQAPVIAGLKNTGYQQALQEFNQQQTSQLGANQANAWLNSQAGFGFGNLGNEALTTKLTGANALLGAGALEQGQTQQQLNVPFQQYQAGQAYPFQTTGWLSNIIQGLGGASGGISSTTSPAPSAGSQVAGLGLAGTGILGQLNQSGAFGSGGWLSGLFGSSGNGATMGNDVANITGGVAGSDGLGFLDSGTWNVRRGGAIPARAEGGIIVPFPNRMRQSGGIVPANDDYWPEPHRARAVGGGLPIHEGFADGGTPKVDPSSSESMDMTKASDYARAQLAPEWISAGDGGYTRDRPFNPDFAKGLDLGTGFGVDSYAERTISQNPNAVPTRIGDSPTQAEWHDPGFGRYAPEPVKGSPYYTFDSQGYATGLTDKGRQAQLAGEQWSKAHTKAETLAGIIGSPAILALPLGVGAGAAALGAAPAFGVGTAGAGLTADLAGGAGITSGAATGSLPAWVTPQNAARLAAQVAKLVHPPERANGGIIQNRDDGGDVLPDDSDSGINIFSTTAEPADSDAAPDYSKAPLPVPPIPPAGGPPAVQRPILSPESRGRMADEGSGSPWKALTYAGLGILGGTSPNAAVNVGRGALAGLNTAETQNLREETARLRAKQADSLTSYRQGTLDARLHGQDLRHQDAQDRIKNQLDLAMVKAMNKAGSHATEGDILSAGISDLMGQENPATPGKTWTRPDAFRELRGYNDRAAANADRSARGWAQIAGSADSRAIREHALAQALDEHEKDRILRATDAQLLAAARISMTAKDLPASIIAVGKGVESIGGKPPARATGPLADPLGIR